MRAHISIRPWLLCCSRLIRSIADLPVHFLVPPVSVCQSRIRSIRSLFQMRLFQTSFLRLQRIPLVVSRSRPVFASVVLTTPGPDMKNSLTGINCSTSDCVVKWGGSPITSRRGTGNWVSVTHVTKVRTFRWARSASPACARRSWIQILPRRSIHS